MNFGNVARVLAVATACLAAAGSATSTSNNSAQLANQGEANSPPPPLAMEPTRALGLWRSTFGAVKIEADDRAGGIAAGGVHGIWVYKRQGQEVVGYFSGNLRGNVLQFHWQEPNNPPLTGEGFIQFDASGRQYQGRWWSDHKDRVGEWNGWRQGEQQGQPQVGQQQPPVDAYGQPYGGQGYGDSYSAPPPPRAPAPPPAPPAPPRPYY